MHQFIAPLAMLGALLLVIAPAAAQNTNKSQPSAAAPEAAYGSPEWLSKRCIDLFNNRKYEAVYGADYDYGYSVITYTFTTSGQITPGAPGDNPYCRIDYTFWDKHTGRMVGGWARFTGWAVFTRFAHHKDAYWRLYLRADGSFLLQTRYVNKAKTGLNVYETVLRPVN